MTGFVLGSIVLCCETGRNAEKNRPCIVIYMNCPSSAIIDAIIDAGKLQHAVIFAMLRRAALASAMVGMWMKGNDSHPRQYIHRPPSTCLL